MKNNNIDKMAASATTSRAHNARIAVIQANWHSDIVTQATSSFIAELTSSGMSRENIDIYDVPGSLEIPLQAKKLLETGRYDLIMATGLIVDGGIYRHDFVARTVLDAMMQVQLDAGIPVLSVVLTPHHFQETDAHMTFFRDHFVIKGREAADAAKMMLGNMAALEQVKLAS